MTQQELLQELGATIGKMSGIEINKFYHQERDGIVDMVYPNLVKAREIMRSLAELQAKKIS